MAGTTSRFSSSQWDTIKAAYIAGTRAEDIMAEFPGLSHANLRKAASRGRWPTHSRIVHEARTAQLAANRLYASQSQHVPPTSQLSQNGVTLENDALSITLESTKTAVNASLGRFAQRAVKTVDNWDIPAPQSMKDGLALVNSLARLHQPAPQHLSQVNMQFVSPWGTASGAASGAKFLEVETPEEP